MKSIVASFIFLFTAFLALSQDFEVAPAKIDFSVEPGQVGATKVTITNHSGIKQGFKIVLGDVVFDKDGNKTNHPAGSTENSCADWLTIAPAYFELNPNENRQIDVSIQVPTGKNKTAWAMIYVKPAVEQKPIDADKEMATGIIITPRIGIYVVQSPKSNNNYSAIIESFKEVTKETDSLRTFEVKVFNNGDKEIDGKVHMLISNLTTLKEKKVGPKKTGMLPGTSKTLTFILPENTKPGKYALAAILDYGHNTALEGAQLIIEVPENGQ